MSLHYLERDEVNGLKLLRRGDELRALRKLQRQEPKATFVFVSHLWATAQPFGL
jgi:hypothetical protein